MAKFPITRATGTLPAVGPSALAGADVAAALEAPSRAMAGLGVGLAELGIRFDVMEGKAQADVAERDAKLSMVQMVNELRTQDDVSKWDSIYNTHTERVAGLIPKNKRGARQYGTAINRLTPIWQERFTGLKSAKREDNMIAASIVKRNDLMNSANIETMPLVIQKLKTELEVLDRLSPTISRTETEICRDD